jgi:hypothetical protein
MARLTGVLVVIAAIILGGGYFNRTQCLSDDGPRTAVLNYIAAMKEGRFEDAYRFVTATMTDSQSATDWALQQSNMFKIAKVVINKIDVRRGHRDLKNIFMCAADAKVSNVLHASDVLNNQGSMEFEIYNLVQDDGEWKIDSQETLFEEAEIYQWFPEELPAGLNGSDG